MSCIDKKQSPSPHCSLNIINSYKFDNKINNSNIFKCNLDRMSVPKGSVLKVKFIKANLLEMRFSSNFGYGGENIVLYVNEKLKITNISYDYFGDTDGGNKEKYLIKNFNLILNKNPFKDSLKGLKGELHLDGIIEIIPNDFYRASFKEDLSFSAYFRCD